MRYLTAAEIEKKYGLKAGVVRAYLFHNAPARHEAYKADARTWLIEETYAASLWSPVADDAYLARRKLAAIDATADYLKQPNNLIASFITGDRLDEIVDEIRLGADLAEDWTAREIIKFAETALERFTMD